MKSSVKQAMHQAYRIYRSTEVAYIAAEREGRDRAVARLHTKLHERWQRYTSLREQYVALLRDERAA